MRLNYHHIKQLILNKPVPGFYIRLIFYILLAAVIWGFREQPDPIPRHLKIKGNATNVITDSTSKSVDGNH
jgi:hypothetical protein